MSSSDIHGAVQRFYAERAEDSGGSCCDRAGQVSGAYKVSLLNEFPSELAGVSLGCGDPITIAGLQAGETVLDLGSGAGLDCFLAARQVGPQGRVIGVDMTPEMVAKAEANLAKVSLENVEFRHGQIEALPVADASVDVIVSNCVINLAPDKLAVFREAYRVLRAGGRVSLSDIVTEGTFSAEQRARLDLWSSCVTGAVEASDYTGLLAQAGFVDVQIADRTAAESPAGGEGPRLFSARITGRKPADAG